MCFSTDRAWSPVSLWFLCSFPWCPVMRLSRFSVSVRQLCFLLCWALPTTVALLSMATLCLLLADLPLCGSCTGSFVSCGPAHAFSQLLACSLHFLWCVLINRQSLFSRNIIYQHFPCGFHSGSFAISQLWSCCFMFSLESVTILSFSLQFSIHLKWIYVYRFLFILCGNMQSTICSWSNMHWQVSCFLCSIA